MEYREIFMFSSFINVFCFKLQYLGQQLTPQAMQMQQQMAQMQMQQQQQMQGLTQLFFEFVI